MDFDPVDYTYNSLKYSVSLKKYTTFQLNICFSVTRVAGQFFRDLKPVGLFSRALLSYVNPTMWALQKKNDESLNKILHG